MAFNMFPYTNFHELNADWLLQTVKKAAQDAQDAAAQIDTFAGRVAALETALPNTAKNRAILTGAELDETPGNSITTSVNSLFLTSQEEPSQGQIVLDQFGIVGVITAYDAQNEEVTIQTADVFIFEKLQYLQQAVDNLYDAIAQPYDPESSYAVYDFCLLDDVLYEAVNASATPAGDFEPDDWILSNLGEAIATARKQLVANFNNLKHAIAPDYQMDGRYYIGDSVWHTNGLYTAIADSANPAGLWAPADWELTPVSVLLARMGAALDAVYGQGNALKAAFAPEYSAASGYDQGDLAWYEGTLYRAEYAIASPAGDFDDTKWNEASMKNELRYLRDDIAFERNRITTTMEDIAAGYSSLTSYAAGDYCLYGGQLYKANSATSGVWDATKWDAVSVAEVLESIPDIKNCNIIQSFQPYGNYTTTCDITNYPTGLYFQYTYDILFIIRLNKESSPYGVGISTISRLGGLDLSGSAQTSSNTVSINLNRYAGVPQPTSIGTYLTYQSGNLNWATIPSQPLVVTFTHTANGDTCSHTYAQINSAYTAGRQIICKIVDETFSYELITQNILKYPTSYLFAFSRINMGDPVTSLDPEDWTITLSEAEIQSNGTIYIHTADM